MTFILLPFGSKQVRIIPQKIAETIKIVIKYEVYLQQFDFLDGFPVIATWSMFLTADEPF